jgi:serine/threonine protein kinase
MNTSHSCPACGKTLAPNAPQGLCPECLLKAGFPTGTPSESGHAGSQHRRFVAPTPAALAPHFPQLEVLELIGQGGMGAVYKARQPALDRLVALKILAPQLSGEPGFAERFTREARALAKLSHPNIVAVHDFGQAGGFHYLVMEFVDGTNLRHVLATEKLPPREALAIVPPICAALQFAHDRGIVHRDIKPENILIDKTGAVKIADFGLAKIAGTKTDDFALTGAGDVMGTPHYMAPEQVERPREVDHRADIYSLGVVFYQMLTGELPLGRFAPPSRKVEVDVRLDEIVLRALEKEPNLRYQQASVLRSDVENVASASTATWTPNAADAIRQKFAHLLGVSIDAAGRSSSSNTPINVFADGNRLVAPVRDPRLPLRCLKTNQPVSKDEFRLRRFEWCPPIVALSLLLTPVAFIIFYYIFRQHVLLPTPLSREGRRIERNQRLIVATLALGGVGFIATGVSRATATTWGTGALFLLLAGVAAVAASMIYAWIKIPLLRLVKLEHGHVWFAGVNPAFLATLPAYQAK